MDPNHPLQRHSDGPSQSRQGNSRTQERSRASRDSIQPQLPSFSEILPTHLHSAIDSDRQEPSLNNFPDEVIFTALPSASTRHRSEFSSPVRSQPSPMLDHFDDMSYNANDGGYPGSSPQRLESSWASPHQYHDLSSPYSTQSRSSYPGQFVPQARSSPNLPPIRDLSHRPERTNGIDHNFTTMSSPYSQSNGSQPSSNGIQDNSQYPSGRQAFYDSQQRYGQTYPATIRPYPLHQTDYSRHSQSPYEPYRMNPSFQPTASNGFDYSLQPMSSPNAGYVVNGDCGDNRSRRRRGNLPKPVTDVLRTWFHEHIDHPYPSEEDKQIFMQRTGLTINQVGNWFINARRRHWPEGRRRARDRGTVGLVSE